MAKTPTLSSIEKLITANHKEVQNRLSGVEEQVRLTNGRVKALETAKAVEDGIEMYKASQNTKRQWDISTIVTLIAALAAVIGALWWTKP